MDGIGGTLSKKGVTDGQDKAVRDPMADNSGYFNEIASNLPDEFEIRDTIGRLRMVKVNADQRENEGIFRELPAVSLLDDIRSILGASRGNIDNYQSNAISDNAFFARGGAARPLMDDCLEAWEEVHQSGSQINTNESNQTMSVPNDPLYDQQWYLFGENGINISNIWADYTGEGVVVAVHDQGIDAGHADLAANYDASHSINCADGSAGGTPQRTEDNHGTAVAGVIGAQGNNGIGMTGIAYNSTLISNYDPFGSASSPSYTTNSYQNTRLYADIENNSWGYSGVMSDDFRNAYFAPVAAALREAVTYGRDGLGCVIVQSAGNSREENDDVNLHNFQNSRYITSVAATDQAGSVAYYSTPGAAILVAAPGNGIVTTDRVGSAGYVADDYVSFGGTSAAAPVVSGVVALMLQANSNLGYRDVQEILAASARMTTSTAASFQYNGATHWNGGGMHFSHDVGAGLVDAHAAVRLAETWQAQSTAANEQSIVSAVSPALAIRDNATVTSSINVTGALNIDHVEVDLNINHTYIGDLLITLTSPDGTTSTLFNHAGESQDNIVFNMSSTQFWGEDGTGTWTLSITDSSGGDVGTLNSWTLRLFGDTLANDDVYIYTNEFGAITDNLTVRQTLNDANGGTDIINAAAVTSDLQIYLDGRTSTIAGRSLNITAGTVENVYGGDGNDYIFGNALSNRLEGWRGNDTLYGYGGSDYLYGGGDNDALFGGEGSDYLYGGEGIDNLNGNSGDDYMNGGIGNDIYTIDSAGDVISEVADGGTDLVYLANLSSYTLGADLENIRILNKAGASVYGNTFSNVFYGNDGSDRFYGNAGSDKLYGYGGNDYLYGGNENDFLYGGEGNDYLYGNSGDDYLNGGAGNDTYTIDSAGDVIAEAADGGTDLVYLSTLSSYTLGANLENLRILNTAGASVYGNTLSNVFYGNDGSDRLYGNAGSDKLYGYGGNDYLYGGNENDFLSGGEGNDYLYGNSGDDYLNGGAGNDTYTIDSAGDVIAEAADGGTDLVYLSTLSSYTLGANLENLRILNTAGVSVNGNALHNVMYGNDGSDSFFGNAGNDKLYGYGGNDYLYGGDGNDSLFGGIGTDTYGFDGSFGNDIIGAAADNNLDRLDLSSFTSSQASIGIGGVGGDDLIITIGGNTVTIADWNRGGGYQLNTFVFSDGTFATNGSNWIS